MVGNYVQCGAALPAEVAARAPSPVEPAFAVPPPPPSPIPAGPVPVERRYPILRTLSVIYKVLGGIAAALTLLVSIGTCITVIVGGPMVRESEKWDGKWGYRCLMWEVWSVGSSWV